MSNSSSLIEWALSAQNATTVNIIQNAVGLFFSLLIFIKSYDFEACLASVREKREAKRKAKEKAKLLKFKRLMELAKEGGEVDISKVNLSEENESTEEKIPESVIKMARRKQKREVV